jgi:hypothetical protein
MGVTDQQVRKLMQEFSKTNNIGIASIRCGMSRKTGSKYLHSDKLPSEIRCKHTWRTRENPFSQDWELVRSKLAQCPELEAKALFDWLCEQRPGRYQEGQLRTFQRHTRQWRALHGPDKEVFFPQVHIPGVRLSTDFTHMESLEITISNQPFSHMLCHCILCYSNWEWGTICHSESMISLKQGLQNTLHQLGHTPAEHWTDHSTAATHAIGKACHAQGWLYNQKYLDLLNHYKILPRTTNVDSPHENGDIESMNGALKSRVKQHLLLRGSRNFEAVDEYRLFLENIFRKCNSTRHVRFTEELKAMRVLDVLPLPEYYEEHPRVSSWSTIQVNKKAYSVPSRLIGEKVTAYRYDDRIEVYFKGVHQLTMPRLTETKKHAINYRHIISWLIRKPGAFSNYRYREDLFPSLLYRWTYDKLCESCSQRTADMDYLRILNRCAQTMESQVTQSLEAIKCLGILPRFSTVLEFLPQETSVIPDISPLPVNLADFDSLLEHAKEKEAENE